MKNIGQVLMLILFIAIQQHVVGQKGQHKMLLSTTDDGRMAITITVDDIPDQKFTITIPEVFAVNV